MHEKKIFFFKFNRSLEGLFIQQKEKRIVEIQMSWMFSYNSEASITIVIFISSDVIGAPVALWEGAFTSGQEPCYRFLSTAYNFNSTKTNELYSAHSSKEHALIPGASTA